MYMPQGSSIRTLVPIAFVFLFLGLGSFALLKHSGKVRHEEKPRVPRFTTNHASSYLGATLTDFNRACKGASSVLNHDSEKYMICPCEAPRKFFTVQLIRAIELRIVKVLNLEYFSSGVRNFTLLGSEKYPTNEWRVLGSFEAHPARAAQYFDVQPQAPVRFVRFLWVTAHAVNALCTMTAFEVFGVDALETLTEGYTITADDLLTTPHAHTSPNSPDSAAQLPALPNADSMLWGTPPNASAAPSVELAEEGGDAALAGFFSEVVVPRPGRAFDALRDCGDAILHNVSGTCWLQEREAFERSARCVCAARSSPSERQSKPFQPGATLLHVVAQMGKQLRMLQRSMDESRALVGNTVWRIEQTETLARRLFTHMHELSRGVAECHEKTQGLLKELEVMKARLVLSCERGDKSDSRGNVMWVWLICSNVLAFLALSCAFFSRQPQHKRFSVFCSQF